MTSMSAFSITRSGSVSRTRNLGEGRDDIVEAFEMLDVTGRIDIDARSEQFLDILIALVVAAAGRVGVGEFVDQHQPGPACDDRVDVHLRMVRP